ncbi:hypothetical protein, partial [Pseudomonas sp.]|uniref:hypothetical protein n=1 Tax=Pseudomonas sp. TaxID=306 RepID=UPI0032D9E6BF
NCFCFRKLSLSNKLTSLQRSLQLSLENQSLVNLKVIQHSHQIGKSYLPERGAFCAELRSIRIRSRRASNLRWQLSSSSVQD